ncbi:hypothetical protein [Aeoliella mucimassa]|uniref:Uncharacterized protein n=1 Tax=Aeoliella mucimassa TaxID=2527972 RepID=A0A518AI34_9BACT|nr:hypothetical protein [Aeoliella mucimassa]QDU54334.1 hypothetical protein Pan181_05150 [Aeoliella mucimassa]
MAPATESSSWRFSFRWLLGAMLHACIGMTLWGFVTHSTINAVEANLVATDFLFSMLPERLVHVVRALAMSSPLIFFGSVLIVLALQVATPARTKCLWYFLATSGALIFPVLYLPIIHRMQEVLCRLLLVMAWTSLGSYLELWLRRSRQHSDEVTQAEEKTAWLASYCSTLSTFVFWTLTFREMFIVL